MNDIPIRGQGNHHMLKRGPSNQRITEAEALDITYHTNTEDSLERGFPSPFRTGSFPPDLLEACDAQQRRLLGERQEGYPVPQGSYILQQGLQQFKEDTQWHQK
jgi:hypothetical protein